MVIRGGVVGDAFAPAAASEPVTVTARDAAPQAAADAPQSEGQPKPAAARACSGSAERRLEPAAIRDRSPN